MLTIFLIIIIAVLCVVLYSEIHELLRLKRVAEDLLTERDWLVRAISKTPTLDRLRADVAARLRHGETESP